MYIWGDGENITVQISEDIRRSNNLDFETYFKNDEQLKIIEFLNDLKNKGLKVSNAAIQRLKEETK